MKITEYFRPKGTSAGDTGTSQCRVRQQASLNMSGPTIPFRIGSIVLVAVLGFLSSLWFFAQVQAQVGFQQGRIDGFTFFIPYPTDRLDDQFDAGYAPISLLDDDIATTISIALLRDNSVIYYDQWEDGLEPDLTTPTQFSTQVWGDNDPANGIPPGFGTDALNAGDVIILQNEVVLPRDPADLFFDGGDALTSIGGAIAVTLAVWPIHDPAAPPPPGGPPEIGILFAGAWELYPTNAWGTEYFIPVGEDLAGVRAGFTVVGLNVQAVQDGTTVEVDLDADGTFETTVPLDQGEQFTQVNGVLVGARVRASEPVQVHTFTANPASSYEARADTMFPRDQWTDDYMAPRSSDGDFWLYNPDGNVLNVTVQTITTTAAITIPGNSTVKYPPVGLSAATGLRFTSDDGRPLYGVAVLDAGQAQDWGYAMQPVERLSTQTLIGFGPGNNNMPPGPGPGDGFESRVYVTAASATTVRVDYDTDGTVDASFPVSPLEEVSITDPNDFDMTGAFLFTDDGTPFVTVWGQDETANPGAPSIDVGTSIVPLPSLLLQKTFNLIDDVDCTGSITVDDTVQFRLDYMNNSVNSFSNAIIEDDLPSALTYVNNSTLANGASVPDSASGTRFPLDAGGFNAGSVPASGTGVVTFDAVVNNMAAPITNRAQVGSADLPLGTDSVTVLVPTGPTTPILEVNNTLISPANGLATSGQTITFSVTITNTSVSTITRLPLEETFNDNRLTFLSATPPPDATAAGLVSWNDLTTIFGSLPPNTTISATISFVVDQIPPAVNRANVVATVVEAERNDSPSLLTCSNRATVNFGGGPSNGDGNGDGNGNGNGRDKTPTPTPTPTPTVSIRVTPTPTVFPVTLLPETGTREDLQADRAIIVVALLSVTLLGIGLTVIHARRRYKGKVYQRK